MQTSSICNRVVNDALDKRFTADGRYITPLGVVTEYVDPDVDVFRRWAGCCNQEREDAFENEALRAGEALLKKYGHSRAWSGALLDEVKDEIEADLEVKLQKMTTEELLASLLGDWMGALAHGIEFDLDPREDVWLRNIAARCAWDDWFSRVAFVVGCEECCVLGHSCWETYKTYCLVMDEHLH